MLYNILLCGHEIYQVNPKLWMKKHVFYQHYLLLKIVKNCFEDMSIISPKCSMPSILKGLAAFYLAQNISTFQYQKLTI